MPSFCRQACCHVRSYASLLPRDSATSCTMKTTAADYPSQRICPYMGGKSSPASAGITTEIGGWRIAACDRLEAVVFSLICVQRIAQIPVVLLNNFIPALPPRRCTFSSRFRASIRTEALAVLNCHRIHVITGIKADLSVA